MHNEYVDVLLDTLFTDCY